MSSEDTPTEDMPWRWQPGQSGSPAGKPKGTRNKTLMALDAIGHENAEAILQSAVAAAIGIPPDLKAAFGALTATPPDVRAAVEAVTGTPPDIRAAEMILSRCWPARRGRPLVLDLPPVHAAGDLPAALAAIVAAAADGTLSPEEAQALGSLLENQRKAIETADLDARITALEAQSNG